MGVCIKTYASSSSNLDHFYITTHTLRSIIVCQTKEHTHSGSALKWALITMHAQQGQCQD